MIKISQCLAIVLIFYSSHAIAEKRISFACKANSDNSSDSFYITGNYIIPEEGATEYRPSGGINVVATDGDKRRLNFVRIGGIEPKDYGLKINTYRGLFGFAASDGSGSRILISHTEGASSGDTILIDLMETSQLKPYQYKYQNAKCRFQ